jgi:hypothetical protein
MVFEVIVTVTIVEEHQVLILDIGLSMCMHATCLITAIESQIM